MLLTRLLWVQDVVGLYASRMQEPCNHNGAYHSINAGMSCSWAGTLLCMILPLEPQGRRSAHFRQMDAKLCWHIEAEMTDTRCFYTQIGAGMVMIVIGDAVWPEVQLQGCSAQIKA